MDYIVSFKHCITFLDYFFYTINLKFKFSTYNISYLSMRVMMKCTYSSFFESIFNTH